MEAVSAALCEKKYSVAIKALGALLSQPGQPSAVREHLLCNRAFCYQHLDLQRKALKVWSRSRSRPPPPLLIGIPGTFCAVQNTPVPPL